MNIEKDDLFEEVKAFAMLHDEFGCSDVQRRFKLGYNRGGRLIDQLEEAGVIGAFEGAKKRKVLMKSAERITISYSVSEAADKEDTILISITGTGIRTNNESHLSFMKTIIETISAEMVAKSSNIPHDRIEIKQPFNQK